MKQQSGAVLIERIFDDTMLLKAREQREKFQRNAAWLQAHIPTVYAQCRGKCICIAGEELFVADTVKEAVALAAAAHPDDEGWFTRYIPKQRAARIYANQR